jgi:hypothetical protein
VEIEQKDLTILNDRVRISDVGFSIAKGFDLAAGENEAGFPGVEDMVVVLRAFVPRDRLPLLFLDCLSHLTSFSS